MNPSVLILGAKGDIAKEIAKVYALHGYDLILSGRKIIELEGFAQDLRRSGVVVELKELDITKDIILILNEKIKKIDIN